MAFNDFVQIELPKRPFVEVDGAPGQILVRSSNLERPRELIWASLGAPEVTFEAGENLPAGTPVKIVANKAYAANNVSDASVIGVLKASVDAASLATIVTGGIVLLPNIVPGAVYFLGAGAMTSIAPSSGYSIRLGVGVTDDKFLVEVESAILLS